MELNQLKYISRILKYIRKILNENPDYKREKDLYSQCCDSLYELKSLEDAVSTLYKKIRQKEEEELKRAQHFCECGGEFIWNEDHIYNDEDRFIKYCEKCYRIFRNPPEYFANYKNYHIKKNPRHCNRLQDNAFKNLYRLGLPLDLRERASDLYGDNKWDKAEMCKCLAKAAEELNYEKYNLEYFRKLYKLDKREERARHRQKYLSKWNH
jgi:hypothetical protein